MFSSRMMLITTAAAALTGCVGAGPTAQDYNGSAVIQFVRVPQQVSCIRIQITSSATGTTFERRFGTNPNQNPTFTLDGLPTGSDAFSAQATPASCAVATFNPPSWATLTPTNALLTPGQRTSVVLNRLEPTGSASVCVPFDDGTDGGC